MAAAGKSVKAGSPSMVDNALNELRQLGYTVFKGRILQAQTLLEFEWQGQAHYDRLGEAVLQYIQAVMQEQLSLRKVSVPMDTQTARGPSPTSDIFVSDDLESNSQGLMLLIQGSGAVRPGQWARALCINNSLMEGTCLPDVQHARARGWAVAVLNPNTSSWTDPKSGIKQFVRGMGGSRHGLSCWDAILSRSPARSIAMIAHSAGGGVAYEMLRKRPEVLKRTQFLALTDAVQCISRRDPPDLQRFYEQQCLDWVTSPPRAQLKKEKGGLRAWVRRHGKSFNGIVNTRPAGHRKHEWTTASARQMVWSVTDTFMRRNGALPPTHKPATGVPMWEQPYAETIAAVVEEERAKRAADAAAGAASAADEEDDEEGKQGESAAGDDDHGKGGGEGSAVSIGSSSITGSPEVSGVAQGDSERDVAQGDSERDVVEGDPQRDAAEVPECEAQAAADDDQDSSGAAASAESQDLSSSTKPTASEEPTSGSGAAGEEVSGDAVGVAS